MLATATLAGGCATVGSTGGIATPWGAAAIHSFRPEKSGTGPSERKVDAQVARLLDDASQSADSNVRVAAR
jgi:hypothetical protein